MQSVYSIVQFSIEKKKINVQYVLKSAQHQQQIIYEDGIFVVIFSFLYSFILKLTSFFLIHIVSA